MKKKILVLALLCAVLLSAAYPLVASARWQYTSSIMLDLYFSGNTANCAVIVTGYQSVTKIDADITLECLNTGQVTYWFRTTNSNMLLFSESAPAVPGNTYRLTVDARVWAGSQYEDILLSTDRKY